MCDKRRDDARISLGHLSRDGAHSAIPQLYVWQSGVAGKHGQADTEIYAIGCESLRDTGHTIRRYRLDHAPVAALCVADRVVFSLHLWRGLDPHGPHSAE